MFVLRKRKSTINTSGKYNLVLQRNSSIWAEWPKPKEKPCIRHREREMLFQVGGQGTRPTFFEMAAAQQLPASLRAALTYSIGVCGFYLWISLVSLGIRSFWDPLKFREFFFFFLVFFLSEQLHGIFCVQTQLKVLHKC